MGVSLNIPKFVGLFAMIVVAAIFLCTYPNALAQDSGLTTPREGSTNGGGGESGGGVTPPADNASTRLSGAGGGVGLGQDPFGTEDDDSNWDNLSDDEWNDLLNALGGDPNAPPPAGAAGGAGNANPPASPSSLFGNHKDGDTEQTPNGSTVTYNDWDGDGVVDQAAVEQSTADGGSTVTRTGFFDTNGDGRPDKVVEHGEDDKNGTSTSFSRTSYIDTNGDGTYDLKDEFKVEFLPSGSPSGYYTTTTEGIDGDHPRVTTDIFTPNTP